MSTLRYGQPNATLCAGAVRLASAWQRASSTDTLMCSSNRLAGFTHSMVAVWN